MGQAITSDGKVLYLSMESNGFEGIVGLNLTSGMMFEVVNFRSDENYDMWGDLDIGHIELSKDDSTLYIMTDDEYWGCEECDQSIFRLDLTTGAFHMVFDVPSAFRGYYDDEEGVMTLSPDGKKMWLAGGYSGYAWVGFVNMDDFSSALVYDRYETWDDYDYSGPSIYFEAYGKPTMTPDGKNFIFFDENENNVLVMPTTPPYNMHSIIGFANYAIPYLTSDWWTRGSEVATACPDRTCDGPVGFANWDDDSYGTMSPDGSFVIAVEDDSDSNKFRKIHIDYRCKIGACK
jgi:hypothetical protein